VTRRAILAVVVAACLVPLSGCGSTSAGSAGQLDLRSLQMTGPRTGYAVWPSGVRWILLRTDDGWRTVKNATPVAVPTDGGLVLATGGGRAAVGVLPYEKLTVSPVMRSEGASRTWTPSQLPSALAASAHALALTDGDAWAVLADGSVMRQHVGSQEWSTSLTASTPGSNGTLDITGVAFPDGRTGFLSGRRSGSGPVLLTTTDGGSRWVDTGITATASTTSYLPCRLGSMWVAPVLSDGRLELRTSSSPTGPWSVGPSLDAASAPLASCGTTMLWAGVRAAGSESLHGFTVQSGWTPLGSVPRPLVSLGATSDAVAYAAAEDDPSVVVELTTGSSLGVAELRLPDWVATIGGAPMRN
jgi:hypothetical protein